jgi:hypothetical protein
MPSERPRINAARSDSPQPTSFEADHEKKMSRMLEARDFFRLQTRQLFTTNLKVSYDSGLMYASEARLQTLSAPNMSAPVHPEPSTPRKRKTPAHNRLPGIKQTLPDCLLVGSIKKGLKKELALTSGKSHKANHR